MKLNLGAGYKHKEGYVNIDDDQLTNPDYVINLDDKNIKLPFEDDSVEEILASHILEHIGEGFIPLMQELYRVSKDGCILDIIVPHERHDVFTGDPTHKRPITVNGMYLFDKKYVKSHMDEYASSSGLAYKFKINFEMIHFEYEYDPFYIPLIESIEQKKKLNQLTDDEYFMYVRLMREANNVAQNTKIKMRAVKPFE